MLYCRCDGVIVHDVVGDGGHGRRVDGAPHVGQQMVDSDVSLGGRAGAEQDGLLAGVGELVCRHNANALIGRG